MTTFTTVTTSNWDKFVLLLWKNWIIQKRHYIQTFFEIVVPVLCCSILLLLRGLVDPGFVEKSTVFHPLSTDLPAGYVWRVFFVGLSKEINEVFPPK